VPQTGAKRPTILIVEDHPAMQDALLKLLAAAFPHCRVIEADSAARALLLCRMEAPALIVMDITLPEMNGIAATRLIKSMYPETVVVMHSSSDLPAYREESAAAGAAAFVGKGHTSRELVPAITRLLPDAAMAGST
jgi:DNA-binding NarL/FixJ family response regulator